VGIFSVIVAAAFETEFYPTTATVWWVVILLSVLCTGAVFILITIAQKYTPASHAGVILTLEPVFAGFVAYFLAGEVLLPRAYVGAAMLIGGILLMEIDIKKVLKLK
jgi:drug/metabolite transporter (DMT)-like permease